MSEQASQFQAIRARKAPYCIAFENGTLARHGCDVNAPAIRYKTHAGAERHIERERKASDISRQRHEAHQQRLEKQKLEREEKLRLKRELLKNRTNADAADGKGSDKDNKQAAIAEAIARAQAKKAERNKENSSENNEAG